MSMEIDADIAELKQLSELAKRPTVKKILSDAIGNFTLKLKADAIAATPTADGDGLSQSAPSQPTSSKSRVYTQKISSYGWDQSDKFVKLYVNNLVGVQKLPSADVTCSFKKDGFELLVNGLNDRNHQLSILKLFDAIVPEESKIKVKTDSILVMLRKSSVANWTGVTDVDRKKKDPIGLKKQTMAPGVDSTILRLSAIALSMFEATAVFNGKL